MGFDLGLLDDPKRLAMLVAAAQMAGGRGNTAQNISQGLLGGVQAYQGALGLQDKRAEEGQQRQVRDILMQQQRRTLDQQGQQDKLAQSAFGPNPNLVANDDEGNAMPQAPGGGGFNEFAQGMARIDPMKAMALQAQMAQLQAKERGTLKPGETAGTWDNGKFIPGYTAPKEQDGIKPGTVREVKSGGNIHTYEWNGDKWQQIATAPQFKPDAPDKPAQPQLYESPNGPVWIQPPARGTASIPVAGTDGAPMGHKRSESLSNDIAKIDSEIKIIDGAASAVKKAPDAFGMMRGLATLGGTIPESLAGRRDAPEERQSRSYLFNVVSKVINERAGAAQSAQELARLRSFLPGETDGAPQIIDKLTAYRAYLGEKRSGLAGSNSGGGLGGWGIREIK